MQRGQAPLLSLVELCRGRYGQAESLRSRRPVEWPMDAVVCRSDVSPAANGGLDLFEQRQPGVFLLKAQTPFLYISRRV